MKDESRMRKSQTEGFEALQHLEPRCLLSSVHLDAAQGDFVFYDLDGDRVTVRLEGPGTAEIDMLDSVSGQENGLRRINSVELLATDETSRFVMDVEMVAMPFRYLVPEGTRPGTTRIRGLTAATIGEIIIPAGVLFDGPGLILSKVQSRLTTGTLLAGADVAVGEFGEGAMVQVHSVESTRSIRSSFLSPDAPLSLEVGTESAFVRSLSVTLGAELSLLVIRGYPQPEDVLVDIPGIDRVTGMAPANSRFAADSIGHLELTGDSVGLAIEVTDLERLDFRGDLVGLDLRAGHVGSINGEGSIRRSLIQAESVDFLVLSGGDLEDTVVRVDGAIGTIAALDASAAGTNGTIRRTTIRSAGRVGSIISNDMVSVSARSGEGIRSLRTLESGRDGSGVARSVRVTAAGLIGNTSFAFGSDDGSNVLMSGVPFGGSFRDSSGTLVSGAVPGTPWTLDAEDVESILEQAIAQARLLGVNATISVTDHEGNILGALRMTDSALVADPGFSIINAGGVGGLEGVGSSSTIQIPSSIFATSKAGTAAFLSTRGNAFTTRTAGYIVQTNFPPGVNFQASGPLFGVQFSSLPTSDINSLPIGLSADPGGLPLYLGSDAVGGIGVELDGVYTVDPSRVGGDPTLEELIALAGQAGFTPPTNIRADHILVNGIRLDYANAEPPALAALGSIPDLGSLGGDITMLIAPRDTPSSMFQSTVVAGITGDTVSTFVSSGGDFVAVTGDANGAERLTQSDVELILGQAHSMNLGLRAMIRRDAPQVSQVSVSVVDLHGNLLGVFRSEDAPVFGFDVSVQKARSAAFFSRDDAGTLLGTAEGGAFAPYVARAAALGINLDGAIALSERAIGFLSRPLFPDGIPNTPAGPFSVAEGSVFSPFNTGLQVDLLTSNLVSFISTFNLIGDEASALAMFDAGLIGGGGVADPALGLGNGLQIFPGAVPLYKNGILVGAIGVSGDGIEQDDAVAFAGATGFQSFSSIQRSDGVVLTGPGLNFRLPYVKLPRAAGTGI